MALAKNHLIAGVLVVAIVLAVGNMVRTCKPAGGTPDIENYGGLGGYAASKIQEFLGGDKRVALILFDESAATIYGKDQYALTEQLKAYGYKVLAEETISAAPLFANPEMAYQGVLPVAFYQQVVSRHPDADAIVSFVGPPVVTGETMPNAAGTPLLIVANAVAEQLTWDLVRSGFIAMAILPREEAIATVPAGTGDAAYFDSMYRVVTRDSLE